MEATVIELRRDGATWKTVAKALNVKRWQSVQMYYLRNLRQDADDVDEIQSLTLMDAVQDDWDARFKRLAKMTGMTVPLVKRLIRRSKNAAMHYNDTPDSEKTWLGYDGDLPERAISDSHMQEIDNQLDSPVSTEHWVPTCALYSKPPPPRLGCPVPSSRLPYPRYSDPEFPREYEAQSAWMPHLDSADCGFEPPSRTDHVPPPEASSPSGRCRKVMMQNIDSYLTSEKGSRK